MTAYTRGNAFERRVAADLHHNGYVCIQTRGSKSPVDVYALKPGQVLVIQAKGGLPLAGDRWSDIITGTGWNELLMLSRRVGAVPLIADRPKPGQVRYHQILAEHTPGKHGWPCRLWTPDDVELAAAIARHPAGKYRT